MPGASLRKAGRTAMPNNLIRRFVSVGLALFMVAGLFLADSATTDAQRRRRKRRSSRPRITNPAIYQPAPGDGENAKTPATPTDDSTADQSQKPARSGEDPDAMKQ